MIRKEEEKFYDYMNSIEHEFIEKKTYTLIDYTEALVKSDVKMYEYLRREQL